MATREAPPPPVIGKAGNLTVFITPSPKKNPTTNLPSTPTPTPTPTPKSNLSPSSKSTFNLSPSPSPSPKSNLSPTSKSTLNVSPSPSPKSNLSPSSKLTFNLSPSQKLSPIPRESPAGADFKEEKTSLPSPAKEAPPPVVQVPPKQFEEYEEGKKVKSHGSFGFFWDAVSRVQEAHSSLDEYLANWFGLDQSKYQWALNDYYETNPKEKEANKITSKTNEIISKGQAV
ncbi:hypothetical protein LUZ60_017488 [Juncus effusus]|nr:hypothetical protein LUZ60_017488 [Juncus effusus]